MARSLVVLSAASLAALLAACAGDPTIPDNAPRPDLNVAVRIPPPPQNVFIRASFDDNPRSFVGRFVPDQLPRAEIDENRAAKTRCSEFIKIEEVNASGSFDSTYNGSNAVSANLGVVPIASAELTKSSEGVLRVKYTLKKKMRANVEDTAGLDRCCKAASDQCAKQFIGEFWYGSGSIYQVISSALAVEASGAAKNISGALDIKDDVAWKQLTEFQDVYFAFRTNETGLGAGVTALGANDCTWANVLPTSLDGQYFVGVSQPLADQALSRDDAMINARKQAVKYLGEFIKSASASRSSAIDGIVADERITAAVAEGLVEKVKDQRWCNPESVEGPGKLLYVTKVLAFFPNQDREAAAKASVTAMKTALKAQGKLTPALEKELDAAAKAIK